ncbi:hypothetical protein Tco_0369507 [Tanacetum coccineum]
MTLIIFLLHAQYSCVLEFDGVAKGNPGRCCMQSMEVWYTLIDGAEAKYKILFGGASNETTMKPERALKEEPNMLVVDVEKFVSPNQDTSRFQSVARYFIMTGRDFIFTKLMVLKIDKHRDIVSQSPLGNKPSVHLEKGISIDERNQFYKSIPFAWNCQDYDRAIGEGMPFSNYFGVFMGKIINVTCEWCIDGPVNQDALNKICDGMIDTSKCVACEYENMLMVNVVVPTPKMAPPPKKTVKPGEIFIYVIHSLSVVCAIKDQTIYV